MINTEEIINTEKIHIREDQPLSDATDLITRHRLNEVPVTDEKGRVKAVFDIFKLVSHLLRGDCSDNGIPDACLRRRINTIGAFEPLRNAAHFPVDRIVLDGNDDYHGILTRSDVIRGLVRESEILMLILDRLDMGIGALSEERKLIYANRFFKDAINPDAESPSAIQLKSILDVLPEGEQWIKDIPLRYQYDKDGVPIVLQYYPLNLTIEKMGVLVLIINNQTVHDFHSIVTDSNVVRSGELKKVQKLFPNIIIEDPKMKTVARLALKAARTVSNVFITGKTGVGKEVIAEIIHRMGPRSNKTFMKINCAAIPENLLESELFGYEKGAFTGATREGKQGLIEAAHGGTFFLDEINSLPMALQAKLLRFLQNKEFYKIGGTRIQHADVRLMVATNCDITEMVKEGGFRQDLYYRLCVIPIQIPGLCERKKDIAPLARHFLRHFSSLYDTPKKFSRNLIKAFEQYEWPGNVRELQHLIEQLVVLVDDCVIDVEHLPDYIQTSPDKHDPIQVRVDNLIPLKEAQDLVEQEIFREAVKQGGSVRQIADKLGVHHSTVVRKLQRYRSGPARVG